MYLRATATYEDGHCAPCDTKKTAQVVSANAVQAEPYKRMSAPEFDEESFDEDPRTADVKIYVAENSEAGTAVGAPVDGDGPGRRTAGKKCLTYTLTGDSSDSFDIDHGTGQITRGSRD